MLMPRRMAGSFGATDGLFRVLLCRAVSKRWCGAHWTANDSHQLMEHLNDRKIHEQLCAAGVFAASNDLVSGQASAPDPENVRVMQRLAARWPNMLAEAARLEAGALEEVRHG